MSKQKCEVCENEFNISELIPSVQLPPGLKSTPLTDGANSKIVYRCRSCWTPIIGICEECGKSGWLNKNDRSIDGIWYYFCDKKCKEKYLNKINNICEDCKKNQATKFMYVENENGKCNSVIFSPDHEETYEGDIIEVCEECSTKECYKEPIFKTKVDN
ncbi:MAG: hypothetical protein PF638_05585 [Candidatus Delongbacteria bacterium]|jgi:hypothetical protein|nr:hypothetical protein [Candidatus Delongbacteria bacterium]